MSVTGTFVNGTSRIQTMGHKNTLFVTKSVKLFCNVSLLNILKKLQDL